LRLRALLCVLVVCFYGGLIAVVQLVCARACYGHTDVVSANDLRSRFTLNARFSQEVIPHIMSEGDEDKEEERRLLYVGRPPAPPHENG
jgi:hypothetical protein